MNNKVKFPGVKIVVALTLLTVLFIIYSVIFPISTFTTDSTWGYDISMTVRYTGGGYTIRIINNSSYYIKHSSSFIIEFFDGFTWRATRRYLITDRPALILVPNMYGEYINRSISTNAFIDRIPGFRYRIIKEVTILHWEDWEDMDELGYFVDKITIAGIVGGFVQTF